MLRFHALICDLITIQDFINQKSVATILGTMFLQESVGIRGQSGSCR
jgi:hypothetical protein